MNTKVRFTYENRVQNVDKLAKMLKRKYDYKKLLFFFNIHFKLYTVLKQSNLKHELFDYNDMGINVEQTVSKFDILVNFFLNK